MYVCMYIYMTYMYICDLLCAQVARVLAGKIQEAVFRMYAWKPQACMLTYAHVC